MQNGRTSEGQTEREQTAGATTARPAGAAQSGDPPADKPSILVAEDASQALILVHYLTRSGYKVRAVSQAVEALRLLEAQPFDALLADLHLPDLPGDELLRRARQKIPGIATLLLTAVPSITYAAACLKEGITDYIAKPVSLPDAGVRVGLALERKRQEREYAKLQADLKRRGEEQAERVSQLFQRTLEMLMQVLEARDLSTSNHSSRVSVLASALTTRLCPENAVFATKVRIAALLHDLGKIGIRESILTKPGPLEAAEFAQIKKNPLISEAILRPLFQDSDLLAMVRHHHEHWDGRGYPDGLAGEAIPQGARIIAVADSYDAMTSAHPYRPAMDPAQALQILRNGAGVQWEGAVVEALLAMEEEGELESLAQELHAPVPEDDSPGEGAPGSELSPRLRRPIIYICGDFDEEAMERLRNKAGALLGRGEQDFLLDMRQVGCLNTEAMQMIYLLHLRARELGGRMALRDVPDHAMEAFRGTQMHEMLFFEVSPVRVSRRASRWKRQGYNYKEATIY